MTTTTTPARKTLKLPQSGVIVSYPPTYTVDDAIAAQTQAQKNKETAKFGLYLAQRICTFNGKQLTLGELRTSITGADYLKLVGTVLGEDDDDGEHEDGGDAGNGGSASDM